MHFKGISTVNITITNNYFTNIYSIKKYTAIYLDFSLSNLNSYVFISNSNFHNIISLDEGAVLSI